MKNHSLHLLVGLCRDIVFRNRGHSNPGEAPTVAVVSRIPIQGSAGQVYGWRGQAEYRHHFQPVPKAPRQQIQE